MYTVCQHNSKYFIQRYLHGTISKEIQIHIFPKQVSLWMGCVKLLPSHEKVTGKIIPFETNGKHHTTD